MISDKARRYGQQRGMMRNKLRDPPTISQKLFAYMYIRLFFKEEDVFTAQELAEAVDARLNTVHVRMTEAWKRGRIDKIEQPRTDNRPIKRLVYKLTPGGVSYGRYIYNHAEKYKLDMRLWLIDVM